jgi:hypothetical protein
MIEMKKTQMEALINATGVSSAELSGANVPNFEQLKLEIMIHKEHVRRGSVSESGTTSMPNGHVQQRRSETGSTGKSDSRLSKSNGEDESALEYAEQLELEVNEQADLIARMQVSNRNPKKRPTATFHYRS